MSTPTSPDEAERAELGRLLAVQLHGIDVRNVRAEGGRKGIDYVGWNELPEWAQATYRKDAKRLVKALVASGLLALAADRDQWKARAEEAMCPHAYAPCPFCAQGLTEPEFDLTPDEKVALQAALWVQRVEAERDAATARAEAAEAQVAAQAERLAAVEADVERILSAHRGRPGGVCSYDHRTLTSWPCGEARAALRTRAALAPADDQAEDTRAAHRRALDRLSLIHWDEYEALYAEERAGDQAEGGA